MKLRRLATVIFAASLVVAAVVALAGVLVWLHTRSSLAEVESLSDARDRAYSIDMAIRYLNHVRLDLEVLRGVAHESRSLAALLEDEPHPEAHTAMLHLDEIETLANNALSMLEGRPDDASIPQRLAPVSGQMRIHETGALDALNRIIEDRNRNIVATLQQSLGLLIVIALVVAALGCLVFWAFYRRIRRPLRDVAEGVRRFGEGDGSVRLAVNGGDELSDIAHLFNQAMEQRADYQQQLQERIKEQRCLYRVVQLTTDDHLPVADVCREVARVIPPHLMYPGAAAARVQLGEDEYTSPGWAEPVAAISAPIRAGNEAIGKVEIAYLEPQPDGEGPFLQEERVLLESIAMHLTRMLRDRATSESLAQTQRMQAIGELTGGVAHDFNNLLTVIQGNAELLDESLRRGDPGSAELADMAAMIDSAARRGAELTQRLLAFARRQPLQPVAVQVNTLLEEMQGLLRRSVGAHVELELKLAETAWPALIDPAQLEAAVLNLVVNARDAMPESGWLTIETANVRLDEAYAESRDEVAPADYLMIAVSDTGSGIARGDMARIFEPFFTTKPKGAGTGLGLSMVHGFIKQSHGHVEAYSEPGEGTTIRMYLPRAAESDAVVRSEREPAEVARGNARVLVVEDDDLVRRYTCDQLAALGYQVRSAGNGPEALAMLEAGEPVDLLLTDIVMPGGMSGKQLADAACSMREGLPVVFMSGYTENAIVHHGRLDPGVRLLSKPFRRRELAHKVHEALADVENDSTGEGNDEH